MESIDYWDDSQFDSYDAFGDSMNMVVNRSMGIWDSAVEDSDDDMGVMVLDTYDIEKTIPFLGRRMTMTLKDDARFVAAATNDLDLTEPCGEEKRLAMATMGGRDFDLNKLPIKSMFKLDDPEREESFIEMLRLLLPNFY